VLNFVRLNAFVLFTLTALSISGCGVEGTTCPCAAYQGECVPCVDDVDRVILDGDGGLSLNQELIDTENGYFLNQEGDGRFTVYAGQQTGIGVRVQTYYGRPAPDIPVTFQINEVSQVRPSGAMLNTQTAASNQLGKASVQVIAPPTPGFFRLTMTAPNTRSITYDVNIVLPPDLDRVSNGPAMGGPACLRTKGEYELESRYQPAAIIGDDFNNAMMTVVQVLTDPGGLVGDMVADRIGGFAGSLVRPIVRSVVNSAIGFVRQNYLPDWGQRALNLATNTAQILTDLEMQGLMRLGDEDEMTCELSGIHIWRQLVFNWTDGCSPNNPGCGRFEIPMSELGISLSESPFEAQIVEHRFVDHMEIYEHELRMNLGVAIIWFIERFVLPEYFQGAQSFGDVLNQIVPCDVVGDLAADRVSVPFVPVDALVEAACREGVEAAGEWLARELADSLNLNAFTIWGECDLRDTRNTPPIKADKIENGVWEGGLPGTFSGELF
jgi:hypothetical protein